MQTIYLTVQLQKQDYIICRNTVSTFPIPCLHSSCFYALLTQNLCIDHFYTLTTIFLFDFKDKLTEEPSLNFYIQRVFPTVTFGASSGPRDHTNRGKISELTKTTKNISANKNQ